MQRKPEHTLDYSSPGEEQRREPTAEEEHREASERYNESTFGERRPIASALLRIVVFAAVAAILIWLLPRRTGRLVALLLLVAFAALEARTHGWSSSGWASLR